jgi:hypothetical protein
MSDNSIGDWTEGAVGKDGLDFTSAETEYGVLKLTAAAQCKASAEPGVGVYVQRTISPLAAGTYFVQTTVRQNIQNSAPNCSSSSATTSGSLFLNEVEKASAEVTSDSDCYSDASANLEGCITLPQSGNLTIRLQSFVTQCGVSNPEQNWGAVSVSLLDPPAQLISVDGIEFVPRGSTTTVTVKTDGPADVALLVSLGGTNGYFGSGGTAVCPAGSPRECTFSFNFTVPEDTSRPFYRVYLDVTSARPCGTSTTSYERLITVVGPNPPVAKCKAGPLVVAVNEAFVIDAGSYDPDFDVLTRVQDADSFAAAGTYVVELRVTQGGGLSDSCNTTVVANDPPVAKCKRAVTVAVNRAFGVDAGSYDPEGDPFVSTRSGPRSYRSAGERAVRLTVTDRYGRASACRTRVVVVPAPAPAKPPAKPPTAAPRSRKRMMAGGGGKAGGRR